MVAIATVAVRRMAVRRMAVRRMPVRRIPVRGVPVRGVPVRGVPVRGVPVRPAGLRHTGGGVIDELDLVRRNALGLEVAREGLREDHDPVGLAIGDPLERAGGPEHLPVIDEPGGGGAVGEDVVQPQDSRGTRRSRALSTAGASAGNEGDAAIITSGRLSAGIAAAWAAAKLSSWRMRWAVSAPHQQGQARDGDAVAARGRGGAGAPTSARGGGAARRPPPRRRGLAPSSPWPTPRSPELCR